MFDFLIVLAMTKENIYKAMTETETEKILYRKMKKTSRKRFRKNFFAKREVLAKEKKKKILRKFE